MASIASFPILPSPPNLSRPVRILLRDVPWAFYESLRAQRSNRNLRMTFDRGDLELISPSQQQGEWGSRFGLFLMELADVLEFQCKPLGATTRKKPEAERGKEADQCFYLASYDQVRGKTINLDLDPPPDLAIEIEVSRSAIDALGVYASIGVPEIWRFDGSSIRIDVMLDPGTYVEVNQSRALPFLQAVEVVRWMERARSMDDDVEWKREVRDWARRELIPRLGPG